MPADEYWEGASDLVIGYRKAFKIRMENEENHWERINDHAAWLTGIYIRHAFQSIAVFVNGFMPKGVKLTDYPEKPFTLQAEEKADAEKKRKAEEEQQKLAMAMFQATIMRFNKRFEGKAKAD